MDPQNAANLKSKIPRPASKQDLITKKLLTTVPRNQAPSKPAVTYKKRLSTAKYKVSHTKDTTSATRNKAQVQPVKKEVKAPSSQSKSVLTSKTNDRLSKNLVKKANKISIAPTTRPDSRTLNSRAVPPRGKVDRNSVAPTKSKTVNPVSKTAVKPPSNQISCSSKTATASCSEKVKNNPPEQVLQKDNHVLQPDIDFVPDEQCRNLILNNRELTPSNFKRTSTFRVSARPQSLFCRNRSSVFGRQAREIALQTLEDITQKRRAKALAEGKGDNPPPTKVEKLPFDRQTNWNKIFGSGKKPLVDKEKLEKQLKMVETMTFSKDPVSQKKIIKFNIPGSNENVVCVPYLNSTPASHQTPPFSNMRTQNRALQSLENLSLSAKTKHILRMTPENFVQSKIQDNFDSRKDFENADFLITPIQEKDNLRTVSKEAEFFDLLEQKSENCLLPSFGIDKENKVTAPPENISKKSKLQAEIERLQAKLAEIDDSSSNESSEDVEQSTGSQLFCAAKTHRDYNDFSLASPKFKTKSDTKLCTNTDPSLNNNERDQYLGNTTDSAADYLSNQFTDLKIGLQENGDDFPASLTDSGYSKATHCLTQSGLSLASTAVTPLAVSENCPERSTCKDVRALTSTKVSSESPRDVMRRFSIFAGMLNPALHNNVTAFNGLHQNSSTSINRNHLLGDNCISSSIDPHRTPAINAVNANVTNKTAAFTKPLNIINEQTDKTIPQKTVDSQINNAINVDDPRNNCANFTNALDENKNDFSVGCVNFSKVDPLRSVHKMDTFRSSFYSSGARGPMPALCTPQPVCLRSARVLTKLNSPDLLPERRTSAYLSSAPIRTPMVLRNLANLPPTPIDEGSIVCQKLKFEDVEESTEELMERCFAKFGSVHDFLTKHERLVDQLADHECQTLLQGVPFPEDHREDPRLLCPVAHTLQTGDQTHFMPIESSC